MMKRILTATLIVSGLLVVFSTSTFAQESDYKLLAPLGTYVPSTTNASSYLEGVFKLTIAIAGALAVLQIMIGQLFWKV